MTTDHRRAAASVRLWIQATLVFVATLVASPSLRAHDGFSLRLNCGGTPYSDSAGNAWSSDAYFSGNSQTHSVRDAIDGTVDDALYQSFQEGRPFFYEIPLDNGDYDIILHFIEPRFDLAGDRIFDVKAEDITVLNDLDILAEVPKFTALTKSFSTNVSDGALSLTFNSPMRPAVISGIEIVSAEGGHPFLHVVINGPETLVDYDDDGDELVTLLGAASHTHEIGHDLVGFEWSRLRRGGTAFGTMGGGSPTTFTQVIGKAENLNGFALPPGTHTLTLTIEDDNNPPETLSGSVTVSVYPKEAVGGVMARYFVRTSEIEGRRQVQEYAEVLPRMELESNGNSIGGSGLTANTRVSLRGKYRATADANYDFQIVGGSRKKMRVDGSLAQGPLFLNEGDHEVEAVFFVDSALDLPVRVEVSVDGGNFEPIENSLLHHDQSQLKPFLNPFSSTGSELGGQSIQLDGIGLFPADSIIVHWGGQTLVEPQISVEQNTIQFLSPAGLGVSPVRVETPLGISNERLFQYTSSQAPVSFVTEQLDPRGDVTQGAWGPDGKLYVAQLPGKVFVYTFDDDYGIQSVDQITPISTLTNKNILGIAFNPLDPPDPVRVYVAHSELFAQGGACFTGTAPYSGQVSVLEGPNFDTVQPLVTGLPVSNHDHGVNGMFFDNYGDLYVCVGGNTNAGVAHCAIGDLPESPLAGALVKVELTNPAFNGTIQYVETVSGLPNDDQVFGDIVDIEDGVHVQTYSTGLRNAFDAILTTDDRIYATDNGPNSGFGDASTSATTQDPTDPNEPDEIVNLVEGNYYGHPNRNRGRTDDRENVYYDPAALPASGTYTGPMQTHSSSVNGLLEYRAMTFGGAMYGNLVYQKLDGVLHNSKLTGNGLDIETTETISNNPTGLDILQGPGGVLIGLDYWDDEVTLSRPIDASVQGNMTAYDVFPWRALPDGNTSFVIGGANFGSLFETIVTFGGTQAVLTSVSPTRIKGFVPAQVASTADMLDVVVENTSSGALSTIPQSFRYLRPWRGTWTSAPDSPLKLGEVAGGIINGVMYLVGEGNDETLAYDIASQTWDSTLAIRPHAGNHHAAEVFQGKLYLLGGLGSSSAGKVQIYDPVTDSWSLGAPAPFASGSASSALIDGKMYYAGGITGAMTVAFSAVYDPVADSWTPLTSMPVGRNHAAFATDGEKMYVFGGRGPGSGDANVVAIGFDDVQVYDPLTDTWEWSDDGGSTIPAVPQKRGGMGRAVFFEREFYIMGGETTSGGTGQVAGNVYNRVDVYNPVTQTWREERLMTTARHGIYPIAYDRKIFVACGGVQAGNSQSKIFEIFSR